MLSQTNPARIGVFISHAHEDEELAQSLRELLVVVLGLDRSRITCTSDPVYGLHRGSELDDQIRQRLDTARALFLLATPNSRGKDWVQYECAYADQASSRGELEFYVLTPTALAVESVPEPYRNRVAVILSRPRDLHAFTTQLRSTLGGAADTGETRVLEPLLMLHARGSALEQRELAETRSGLEEKTRQLQAERDRLRSRRVWSQGAAAVLLAALLASVWAYRALDAARDAEITRLKNDQVAELGRTTLAMERARDEELRSLPLSGFFQDSQNRLVPCLRVTAHVFEADGRTPKRIVKDCRAGRFTFDVRELGMDPRDRFTLTVDLKNNAHDVSVDRPTAPVALIISEGAP